MTFELTSIEKHTSKATLKPGHLYSAMVTHTQFDGDDYDSGDALVFFASDGNFYDADSGEECSPDFDYLIEQDGAYDAQYAADGNADAAAEQRARELEIMQSRGEI